ncbi:MAG: glycosyltransferase family 2 protein [Candidatus Cloacimonetes bacterium]|nr:glycosyltransferase family 2 protein [Candidatus Cloacimonadota bacterium]
MDKLLSICLIFKNEEKHLPYFLECFGGVADELILVDTGSEDDSCKIIKDHGFEFSHFDWCNDFSKAKNYGMSLCSSQWILVLDADERMSQQDIEFVKNILSKSDMDGFYLPVVNLRSADWRRDTNSYSSKQYRMNLVRNHKGFHYKYPIHERLDISLESSNASISSIEVPIYHLGYIDEVCEDKENRNIELIESLYNEDKQNPHLILYHCLGKWSSSDEIYKELQRSNALSLSKKDHEQLYRGLVLEIKWLEEFNPKSSSIKVHLNKLLELDPLSGFYHYKEGKIQMALGDSNKAFAAFKIAKEGLMTDLSGDDTARYEITDNLGVLYGIRGEYKLAEDCFLDLERYFTRNPSTWHQLLKVYFIQKKYRDFLEALANPEQSAIGLERNKKIEINKMVNSLEFSHKKEMLHFLNEVMGEV